MLCDKYGEYYNTSTIIDASKLITDMVKYVKTVSSKSMQKWLYMNN